MTTMLHDPVIDPNGGRRCDFPVSDTDRCNLLEEEHEPLLYIATLDLGGISYSGREFVAVGLSIEEAKAALVAAVTKDGAPEPNNEPLTTVDAIDEWYGIHVHGPVIVGRGIRTDG